jgi:hypothetical protein
MASRRVFEVDFLFEWFAPPEGGLGTWLFWIAVLLVLGGLPALLPRRADEGPRAVIAVWFSVLVAAVLWTNGDAIARWLRETSQAAQRDLAANSGRLEPLMARLPSDAVTRIPQLPWLEIGVVVAVAALAAVFYLPRHPRRFGR